MIPNHIRNEVLRRIQTADNLDPQLISTLGISPAAKPLERTAPLEPHAPAPDEGEWFSGHVPFELAISALGETTRLDCRVSYVVTLCDDEDRHTDEPIRIMGHMQMRYEMLDWCDPDECDAETGEPNRNPVPQWVDVNLFPLISRSVERKLDDLIEERAIAQEQQALRGKLHP